MNRWQLHLAIKQLQAGGIIAYPTESVYGLGCDASNLYAVSRLLSLKKRSYNKGLILLVSDINQAKKFIKPLTSKQLEKINTTSKRATTWLINKQPEVSVLLSGNHEKLAIRVTSNPVARALCEAFDSPIISTSCNLNKKPTSNRVSVIRNKMLGSVDIISGRCCEQEPSQIIDLESMKVLRS